MKSSTFSDNFCIRQLKKDGKGKYPQFLSRTYSSLLHYHHKKWISLFLCYLSPSLHPFKLAAMRRQKITKLLSFLDTQAHGKTFQMFRKHPLTTWRKWILTWCLQMISKSWSDYFSTRKREKDRKLFRFYLKMQLFQKTTTKKQPTLLSKVNFFLTKTWSLTLSTSSFRRTLSFYHSLRPTQSKQINYKFKH